MILTKFRAIASFKVNFRFRCICTTSKQAWKQKSKSSAVEARHGGSPVELGKKNEEIVWNPCNIQMIPDSLYEQIFIDKFRQKAFPEGVKHECEKHLQSHSLWGQRVNPSVPISLSLPRLEGEDINDHFRNIALQQTFRYKKLMDVIASSALPAKPKEWKFVKGWTKYLDNGTSVSVPYPDEDAMVFDVEVSVTSGNAPTLACAVSPNAWYSWCSEALIMKANEASKKEDAKLYLKDLIPLETLDGESSIPKDCQKEKIIIGHNVSYDRARIKEQYFFKSTKTRFMDTMSLHIAVSGITSFQRALKLTENAGLKTMSIKDMRRMGMESSILEWGDQSSLNNLADVYKLYCGQELNKSSRDVFVKGSLDDVRAEFQDLVTYCSNDVEATKGVFSKLLPLFYERFPHPVTLSGMLEMGTTYLPINSNWRKYLENSERTFNEYEMDVKSLLMEKAEDAVKLLEGERYKEDPWLWDLDWKVPKRRSKKQQSTDEAKPMPAWYRKLLYKESDKDYMPGPGKLSTSMQLVPKLLRLSWFGFPLHYSRKGGWGFLINKMDIPATSLESELDSDNDVDSDILFNQENDDIAEDDRPASSFPYDHWFPIWKEAREKLLRRSQIQTVEASRESVIDVAGVELRNKSEQSAEEIADFIRGLDALAASGLWSKSKKNKGAAPVTGCSPHPKCVFVPLPHKDGPSNRVGNPLAKDFLSKIEEGVLSSSGDNSVANKVVRLSKGASYWKNNRDRILGQMAIWFESNEVPDEWLNSADGVTEYGAILPQVAVSGTLTRRAVEPTWMTASNAYEDRIGSELKGMVQASPSSHFVGADVDSQELWIASIIGDASFVGVHGSTALGWMTLQGNKSAGTDMHSKTATLIGIGRDQAKILNYGRIYGAGVNFAERLLMQFNRQLNSTDARSKAKTMYQMTKGDRKYLLNEEGRRLCEALEDFRDRMFEPFSKTDIRALLNFHQIPSHFFMELVDKMVWEGGTESHMFNRLEAIAQEECPRTPVLKCCISRSLVPSVVHKDFMTSRVNWVVQSSAVDYLHLMLTCMRWLIEKYDIDARLSISVHDEVRYLVGSEDRHRAALALQITNLLTRSVCAYQLGMYDLPMSVAFFSCIDIDKVLRKEVTQDCITPSNFQGLSKGYGIDLGQGFDITELLKITKGLEKMDSSPKDV